MAVILNESLDNPGLVPLDPQEVLSALRGRLDLSMVMDSPQSARYAVSAVNGANQPILTGTQAGNGVGQIGSAGVTSFNGRNGSVVPTNADYSQSLVKFTDGSNGQDLQPKALMGYNLTQPGSGQTTGNIFNQNPGSGANYGTNWSGLTISYSGATDTTKTIAATAATLQGNGASVSFNSASVVVTGTSGTTVTYYLYYNDPTYAGGSQTLQATTSFNTANGGAGYLFVGSVSVTFTTGTGGGGTGGCPVMDAWVLRVFPEEHRPWEHLRARDVHEGMFLMLRDGRAGLVTYAKPELQPCVALEDGDGRVLLTCSTSAPLAVAYSDISVPAMHAKGMQIEARHAMDGVKIERVRRVGRRQVMHITCENDFFWTGDDPHIMLAHHNAKPPAL